METSKKDYLKDAVDVMVKSQENLNALRKKIAQLADGGSESMRITDDIMSIENDICDAYMTCIENGITDKELMTALNSMKDNKEMKYTLGLLIKKLKDYSKFIEEQGEK